jgi:hypothetical protein
MVVRRWLLGPVGLASAGCTHAAGSQAATPTQAASPGAGPEKIDAEDIRIDLAPHGMAASIVAPHDAGVHVTSNGVELQGGDGFHLIVRRGSLDPLAEKASIVHEYGVGFRRFVRDDGTEVVYETSFAGENRFHFFLTSDADAPIAYHCRTPDDGIASFDAIETMIAACREVRFRADIETESLPLAARGG